MIKESHEKVFSDAQRCLDVAKMTHEKLNISMEKLQPTTVDVEKDLKVLTSKKKKLLCLLANVKRSFPKVKRMSPLRRAIFTPLRQIM